ncbi:HNH endonuclease signature motif containing protein [Chryseoglobus sp. 28M-23]|uniref:HNH endonuclease signature motif containing protein n=1 Tax=Chryseoglobus sp. 28M-23 TaxID=2772253 RepID=UPI0017460720|nr:HNH endonuclease signature motif containing protein [Chryseoglobus sp. 28M-23]QOD92798.1 DUF222 domain-containing protein [Chryseoglobus sp. 28M-23]
MTITTMLAPPMPAVPAAALPRHPSRGATDDTISEVSGVVEVAGALTAARDALAAVPREVQVFRALDDAELLDLTRLAADEVRLAQLHVSLLAGEIARRSAPELGHAGLAQRTGHRTPEEMVRVTTGTRVADARTAVRVGTTVGAETPTPLGDAVLSGRVSVAVADAVRTGLGRPTSTMSETDLDAAAERLLPRLDGLDADRAAREARTVRDALDLDGIADREEARRQQRSFRLGRRPDGMGYAHWILDPETFALVSDVYDRITSPRRHEPRFQSDTEREHDAQEAAHPAFDDDRTPQQRASDTIAELLRQGAAADTSQLLGDEPVGVRMIIAARTLEERRGQGWIEGHPDAISVATIERRACTAGTITLTVDGHPDNAGQPLNLGRERRLFTRAQRLALAARDGGCRWPGCQRPPSWCEAHHIHHWHRDHGTTDIADGILLCRHHHLLAHNNGWEIERAGPTYRLIPPPGPPPSPHGTQANARLGAHRGDPPAERGNPPAEPIDMPSRSPALRDALRA